MHGISPSQQNAPQPAPQQAQNLAVVASLLAQMQGMGAGQAYGPTQTHGSVTGTTAAASASASAATVSDSQTAAAHGREAMEAGQQQGERAQSNVPWQMSHSQASSMLARIGEQYRKQDRPVVGEEDGAQSRKQSFFAGDGRDRDETAAGFQPPSLASALNMTGPSPLRPPDANAHAQCMQFLQQAWDSGQLQAPPTPNVTNDSSSSPQQQQQEGDDAPKSPPKTSNAQDQARLPAAFFPEMFSPLKTGSLPAINLNSPTAFEAFATPDLSSFHPPFSPLAGTSAQTGSVTPQKQLRSPSGDGTGHPSILLASPQFLIGQPSPFTNYLYSPLGFSSFSPRRFSLDEAAAAASSSSSALRSQQQQQQQQQQSSASSDVPSGGELHLQPAPSPYGAPGRRTRTRKARNLTLPGSSLGTSRVDDTDLLAATETVIRTDAPSEGSVDGSSGGHSKGGARGNKRRGGAGRGGSGRGGGGKRRGGGSGGATKRAKQKK
ncbi:hypothetical protein PTSG_10566 [Salpingoeca rosetta]|uniref:Uncharacterized protein n=1 Tax=Salpingoeca rosetta (strain ATCC 50818 / BSB-021) TaxID=946362 RepID=F2URQ6_SALR5|nr:uncharacterized protein PTSG_10566 [Salpingoeca rosetta]EGD80311.1 hypothetical protein PTSG_10566 [Salpingoeca rosetta]|eukprot:XP_004988101.1 hypothetical protein PTSG_10566 [Salpingoeca rosetta]